MSDILDKNKDAIIEASKLEGSKEAINLLKKIAKEKLPDGISSLINTPIGGVVLANVINELLPRITDNELAQEMSTAAMTSSYQQLLSEFKIYEIAEEFVKSFVEKKNIKKRKNN